MIKINKPTAKPIVLNIKRQCKLDRGTTANKKRYTRSQADYIAGVKKFSFDSKIYGHDNIKDSLILCQHGKCAFCEQNVTSVAYGDIEHFRPKGGYSQNAKDTLHYPGYYWLAYDWDNFLFACAICNQREKKNLFPLLNPDLRVKDHRGNVKREKPFFINPAKENPRQLIKFIGPTATGIDRRHRGKKTIENIGLNRKGDIGISDLYELRNEYFEIIEDTYEISRMAPSQLFSQARIERAKQKMHNLRTKKKRFSAMVLDNFPA
jgi:uncharacterized protein (TIGR02646 family)